MKTANLIKLAASNPKARKALIPLIIKSANLKNKEVVKGLVKLAMSNPEYAELFAERIASEPSYRDYVDRKRKQGEKPLSEEEWESRVKGKGDGDGKGDEDKGDSEDGVKKNIRQKNVWQKNISEGGMVEDEAEVFEDAKVYGMARVYENAEVSGKAEIFGEAEVWGDAKVSENAQVSGNAEVGEKAVISGKARVINQASVRGKASISGSAIVGGTSKIDGTSKINGKAQVKNSEIVDSLITGTAELQGVIVAGDQTRVVIIGGTWNADENRGLLRRDGLVEYGHWKNPEGYVIAKDSKLDDEDFEELKAFREKKSKQKKGKKSWEELKKEFLQNAKDPETKKRVQEMSPKDFEIMMKAIATDEEVAEAEKMG